MALETLPEADVPQVESGSAIRLHEKNETAENNSALGAKASIGINEGMEGRRVQAILANGGRIDATSLQAEDMDLTMIDRLCAKIGADGAKLSFANVTTDLRAANQAFFNGLEQRGITITSERVNPDAAVAKEAPSTVYEQVTGASDETMSN